MRNSRRFNAANKVLSIVMTASMVLSLFPTAGLAELVDQGGAAVEAAQSSADDPVEGSSSDSSEPSDESVEAVEARVVTVTLVPTEEDGGDVSQSATATEGSADALAVPDPAFYQVGYEQTGWNTAADGSGAQLSLAPTQAEVVAAAGSTATQLTLYATWEARSITVRFYGNGATGGSMDAQKLRYDEETSLAANGFEREGWHFVGWSTTPDGESIEDDPATTDVDEFYLASTFTGNTTLLRDVASSDTDGDGVRESFDLAYAVGADVEPATQADKDAKAALDDSDDAERYTITLFAQWERGAEEDAETEEGSAASGDDASATADASPSVSSPIPVTNADNYLADVRDADDGAIDDGLEATVTENDLSSQIAVPLTASPLRSKSLSLTLNPTTLAAGEGESTTTETNNTISYATLSWIPNPDGGNRDALSDEDNDGTNETLTVTTTSNSSQKVRAQLSIGLTGKDDYEAGAIQIVLPGHIFKTRTGANAGNLVLPLVENPGTRTEFNWSYDAVADTYTLTSTRALGANAIINIQMDIENLTPSDLVDYDLSSELYAELYASTQNDGVLTTTTNSLKARFDTQEEVYEAYMSHPRVAYETGLTAEQIQSQYDSSFTGADGVSSYVVVTYYTYAYTKGNTNYTLTWDATADSYDGIAINAPQTVVDDDWRSNGRTGYQYVYVAYPYELTSDYSGTTADGTQVSLGEGETAYYFTKDTTYDLTSSVTWTLTETDGEGTGEQIAAGVEGQKVTTSTATDTVSFRWTDPHEVEATWPDYSFRVKTWGDDNDDAKTLHYNYSSRSYTVANRNLTQSSESAYDYYGIYPVALNKLVSDKDVNVQYEKVLRARNILADGQSVSTTANNTIDFSLVSAGYSLGNTSLERSKDYDVTSITVYAPRGVWAANVDEKNFSTAVTNETEWPKSYVEYTTDDGATWITVRTIEWDKVSNDSPRKYVTVQFGSADDQIPTNATNWRVRIAVPEGILVEDEYVIADVTLHATDQIKTAAQAALDASGATTATPTLNLLDHDTWTVALRDGATASLAGTTTSGTLTATDRLQGYNQNLRVSATADLSVSAWDNPASYVTVTFTGTDHERSSILSRTAYDEAVENGLPQETSGTWYALLPVGVRADLSTVSLRSGDLVTDSWVVNNYEGTGRQLLVVKAELAAEPYADSDDTYLIADAPSITFEGTYSYESYLDYGSDLHYVVAFESGADEQLGNVEGYIGEPDDPTHGNNVTTSSAFDPKDADNAASERKAMTDLDKSTNTARFVYAGASGYVPTPLEKSVDSITKYVDASGSGIYTSGQNVDDEQVAYLGDEYSYRISYTKARDESGNAQYSTGIVLYDRIENPLEDSKLSEGERENSWTGLLLGVDLSAIEEMGVEPTLYYSTANLDLATFTDSSSSQGALVSDAELTDTGVWTATTPEALAAMSATERAQITALAVDCSKDANGNDYQLQEGSLTMRVRMRAPSGSTGVELYEKEASAYNNSLVSYQLFGETISSGTVALRSSYTRVGLKPYSVKVTNAWIDGDDCDGIRPDVVTVTLVARDEDGRELSLDDLGVKKSNLTGQLNLADGTKTEAILFENLPLTTESGEQIHYDARVTRNTDGTELSVVPTTAEERGVTTGYSQGKTYFTDTDGVYEIDVLNVHTPEKTSVSVTKLWEGDEAEGIDTNAVRPASISVSLYKQSGESTDPTLVRTATVTPTGDGDWSYTFSGLYLFENHGTKINYSVVEARASSGDERLASYVVGSSEAVDGGFSITNTYHPYGNLVISKTVEGATSATTDQAFTFKVEWGENDIYYEPVVYVKTAADNTTTTATLENGGTITLKADEYATLQELPQGVTYTVTEENVPSGYTADDEVLQGTIQPNAENRADFTNTYVTKGDLSIKAAKTLKGREQTIGQFSFRLQDATSGSETYGTILRAASSVPNEDDATKGTVTFGALHYTNADDGQKYTYTIFEYDRGQQSYTYSDAQFQVEVTPHDIGDGTMSVDTTYYALDANGDRTGDAINTSDVTFENTYTATGTVTLTAYKRLANGTLKSGDFAFDLYDAQGAVKDADGNSVEVFNDGSVVRFSRDLTQDDAGKTFVYYALENKDKGGYTDKTNVNFDTDPKVWAVTVVDMGDGTLQVTTTTLKASEVLEKGTDGAWTVKSEWADPAKVTSQMVTDAASTETPVFQNEVKPGNLSITKTVSSAPTDDESLFTFDVDIMDQNGNPLSGTLYYDLVDDTGADVKGDEDHDHNVNVTFDEGSSSSASPSSAKGQPSPLDQLVNGISAIFSPTVAHAADDGIASGTWGSVSWVISADGTLTLGSADGSNPAVGTNISSSGGVPWHNNLSDIKSVKVASGVTIQLPERASYLFYNCTNLTSLDLKNFDTSHVTDMSYMFSSCSSLTSLDVSNFDTSKVTSMTGMFSSCSGLTSLDVSNFYTSKVTSMREMFYGCSKLTSLDLSNFDTSKVTNMGEMFYGCSKLTSLDLSNFDTSKVTSMRRMFYECSGLTSLNVSKFDTSKVTNMSNMFFRCSGLASLDLSNFDTSRVTDMSSMFYGCSKLTSLDVSNFDTSRVTSMTAMFYSCSKLTSLDVSNFDTSGVTSMNAMFKDCSGLRSLSVTNFDTSNVTNMYEMFSGCSGLTSLDVTNFNTQNVTDMTFMFQKCSGLTSLDVTNFDTSKVTSMRFMFNGCSKLTSLDVSNFDTSKVTSIYAMFSGCSRLATLDVSNFDTSGVDDLFAMFSGCSGLTSLDVSNFDTSKVTRMNSMFSGCSGLTSLDLSNFDTSKVTTMEEMFEDCSKLTSLDVTNFDTSKVTNMQEMFRNCSQLTSLDVTNFDTSRVTSMGEMFYGCSKLTSLDLSSFDTVNVTSMRSMFNSCTSLTALDVSGWDTSHFSSTLSWPTSLQQLTIGGRDASHPGDYTNVNTQLPRSTQYDTYYPYWVNEADDSISYNYGSESVTEMTTTYYVLEGTHPSLIVSIKDGTAASGTYVWMRKSAPSWRIAYDANGGDGSIATTNTTSTTVHTVANPGSSIYRYGYTFDGWNTNAYGNGKAYAVGETITYDSVASSLDDTGALVLYAQWKEDPNTEATNGHFTVTLEAGQTITLKNLPAGATYRVVEQDQTSWELTSSDGTTGTIPANSTAAASFTNTYNAAKTSVSATIAAQKLFDGGTASASGYSFSLKDTSGNEVKTATSGTGGAIVFEPISYDAEGTYTYTIVENAGTTEGVTYDSHEETVTVTVSSDNGTLSAAVAYDETGAIFNNTTEASKPVSLTITKEISGVTASDKTFTFDVTLTKEGELLSGTYGGVEFTNGKGTVTITGADSVTLSNLPAGTTYEVSEPTASIPPGYALTGSNNTSGTIAGGGSATATFTNTYTASGSVTLTAAKTLRGRDLEYGEFTFKLKDADGDTLTVGDEEQAVTNTGDGSVRFIPIPYDQGDAGKTYSYWVVEDATEDPDADVVYDKSVYEYVVSLSDDGAGNLTSSVAVYEVSAIGDKHAEGATAVEGNVPTFENVLKIAMPLTGGAGVDWSYLGAVAALGGTAAYAWWRKRRRQAEGGGDAR